ncbi:hypothetical protein H5T87_04260 [bacterium]|nr:hypothetical protein [bacterium]
MKLITRNLALFLIFIAMTILPLLGQVNPVTNGGFEELNEQGFPLHWEPVGGPPTSEIGVSPDAHSGKYSLRLHRVKEVPTEETGLNRAWKPFSGEQGSMLSELKGAISFWYKAVSADKDTKLTFFVIPMSAKPLEDTGNPRQAYVVPKSHIGDGKWHKAVVTYDFSKKPEVKWIMLAPRIIGGRGDWLIDDVEYLPNAGAVPAINKLYIDEIAGQEGKACFVKVEIQNIGDEVGDINITLTLPPYLKTSSPLFQEVKSLGIKEFPREISWKVEGVREKVDSIKITAVSKAGWEAESELKLAPSLKAELRLNQFILSTHQNGSISLILTNDGTAIEKDIVARISLPDSIKLLDTADKKLDSLAPKSSTKLNWLIKAQKESKEEAIKIELNSPEGKQVFSGNIIIGAPFPASLSLPPRLNATIRNGVAIISNENLALVFPRSSFGYGIGEIMVKQKGEWKVVGRIPYLAKVVYSLAGERKTLPIYASSPKPTTKGDEASLTFSTLFKDKENGNWRFQLVLTLGKGKDTLKADYSLTCDKDRDVLLFEGPLLYAGEGSFGEAKEEALFPGLEWLVDGERSSSSLDISEDHPDRIRYVPHPNKITIPLMSVYSKGLCLALLWNPYQKWDGANDRPSAVFASPDWFENRNSHLMGLFLPSVPQWVKENERIASTPYKLSKGKSLKLQAYIFATGTAKDSLSAMDKWFALFGVPEPMPIPRGNYLKEIEFSMNAYLHSLWVPEEEQWWTTKGAGPLLSGKGRPSPFLYDLYQGYLLSPSKEIRERCKEMIDMMTSKYKIEIAGDDLGFTFNEPVRSMKGLAIQAINLLNQQWEDGSWRFYANRLGSGVFEGYDYRQLGPHNAVEVGTCAYNAWQILRYARMTGDEKLLEAGIKALEFMKRFTVPRAAQVWEVPVHTPDVLAASDAVDAYIEGYRATGNKTYLEEAKKWARKGLPFIYMWNDPKFPFMRYASIPVFGASLYQGSWFGRPVQWNGLRYAYALLKLWDYDKSFPWKTVAEGITRSAMYQQDEKGENIALWPDSIGAIKGDKASWVFSPMMILKCVYKLLGRDSEPQTLKVSEFRINYRGSVRDVSYRRGNLALEIKLPTGEPGSIVIAGTSKPQRVRLNGKEIGFEYDSNMAVLGIKLPQSSTWQKVEIEGIMPKRVSALPEIKKRIDFSFDESDEGWVAQNDIDSLHVENGYLKGIATGGDPYMVRLGMDVKGDECKRLRIRMMTTGGTNAQFYWTTEDSPNFAEDKVVVFNIISDGEFHEYVVEVGNHPMWKGKRITAIRLDPTNSAPNATFAIDYIKGE